MELFLKYAIPAHARWPLFARIRLSKARLAESYTQVQLLTFRDVWSIIPLWVWREPFSYFNHVEPAFSICSLRSPSALHAISEIAPPDNWHRTCSLAQE